MSRTQKHISRLMMKPLFQVCNNCIGDTSDVTVGLDWNQLKVGQKNKPFFVVPSSYFSLPIRLIKILSFPANSFSPEGKTLITESWKQSLTDAHYFSNGKERTIYLYIFFWRKTISNTYMFHYDKTKKTQQYNNARLTGRSLQYAVFL